MSLLKLQSEAILSVCVLSGTVKLRFCNVTLGFLRQCNAYCSQGHLFWYLKWSKNILGNLSQHRGSTFRRTGAGSFLQVLCTVNKSKTKAVPLCYWKVRLSINSLELSWHICVGCEGWYCFVFCFFLLRLLITAAEEKQHTVVFNFQSAMPHICKVRQKPDWCYKSGDTNRPCELYHGSLGFYTLNVVLVA